MTPDPTRDPGDEPASGPAATDGPAAWDEWDNFVRPFAITSGRTRAKIELRLESMVEAVPGIDPARLGAEVQPLVQACARSQSIAELVGLLHLPVGVVKILAADLVQSGDLVLHETRTADIDVSLVDRILDGVRAL